MGCSGRQLTPNESAFLASEVQRTAVNYSAVEITKSFDSGIDSFYRKLQDELLLDESASDAVRSMSRDSIKSLLRKKIAAITVFNEIYFGEKFYQDDFTLLINDAALLAHEVTHVWQWQKRNETGYTLWKVTLEHIMHKDPYYYESDLPNKVSLLDFRFEQQAAIVGDFVMAYYTPGEQPNEAIITKLVREAFPTTDLVRFLKIGPTKSTE